MLIYLSVPANHCYSLFCLFLPVACRSEWAERVFKCSPPVYGGRHLIRQYWTTAMCGTMGGGYPTKEFHSRAFTSLYTPLPPAPFPPAITAQFVKDSILLQYRVRFTAWESMQEVATPWPSHTIDSMKAPAC